MSFYYFPNDRVTDYPTRKPNGGLQFSPYEENGSTVVAIAGEDYAIIAADTRLSRGRRICTRYQNKLFEVTEKGVLGCVGCWCDVLTFTGVLKSRLQIYKHDNNKFISVVGCSQMLSTMLYYKRFFPYGISNILAGLDNDGKGCVFRYDPIGHFERTTSAAGGSGSSFVEPILDNLIESKNMVHPRNKPLALEDSLNILKDIFTGVAERDIFTGDSAEIRIITADGMERDWLELRKD